MINAITKYVLCNAEEPSSDTQTVNALLPQGWNLLFIAFLRHSFVNHSSLNSTYSYFKLISNITAVIANISKCYNDIFWVLVIWSNFQQKSEVMHGAKRKPHPKNSALFRSRCFFTPIDFLLNARITKQFIRIDDRYVKAKTHKNMIFTFCVWKVDVSWRKF